MLCNVSGPRRIPDGFQAATAKIKVKPPGVQPGCGTFLYKARGPYRALFLIRTVLITCFKLSICPAAWQAGHAVSCKDIKCRKFLKAESCIVVRQQLRVGQRAAAEVHLLLGTTVWPCSLKKSRNAWRTRLPAKPAPCPPPRLSPHAWWSGHQHEAPSAHCLC